MDNFINWSEEEIEKLINQVYGGVVTIDALPKPLYDAILDKMVDAIIDGFGDFDGSVQEAAFTSMTDSVKDFSFAKVFQQINDFENFIFDAKGNKLAFSEFKEIASEIFNIYNGAWLETEFNTAITAAESAKDYLQYQEDKEALPLLKYSTVGDERVRASHKKLDGIIRPVDDAFWDEYLPPNDFNCRCIVEQLEEGEVSDVSKLKIDTVPDLFKNNPVKSGEIFKTDSHPYFKGLGGRKNAF